MDSEPTTHETSEAIVTFKQALEQLVLESFTHGVPLEDTWNITVPVADAPNWTVTIEKTYSEESSSYQPHLLEE